jgi:hypothetical protein
MKQYLNYGAKIRSVCVKIWRGYEKKAKKLSSGDFLGRGLPKKAHIVNIYKSTN